MKLADLGANLAVMLQIPVAEINELMRALREGTSTFDPESGGVDIPDVPTISPEDLRDTFRSRRGPGGGVDADPFRAAFLLIAILIDGQKKDAANETWLAWHIHYGQRAARWGDEMHQPIPSCPLTGETLFGDAIRSIVADVDLAARVGSVQVSGKRDAAIVYDGDQISNFGKGVRNQQALMKRATEIDGQVVQWIAMALAREAGR